MVPLPIHVRVPEIVTSKYVHIPNPWMVGGLYVIIICFIAVCVVCFLKVLAFTFWECTFFSLHQRVIQCFLECWYDMDCRRWMWWSYVPFPAIVRWHLFAQCTTMYICSKQIPGRSGRWPVFQIPGEEVLLDLGHC